MTINQSRRKCYFLFSFSFLFLLTPTRSSDPISSKWWLCCWIIFLLQLNKRNPLLSICLWGTINQITQCHQFRKLCNPRTQIKREARSVAPFQLVGCYFTGVEPSPCFSNFLARTTFVLESLPEAKNPGQDAFWGILVFSRGEYLSQKNLKLSICHYRPFWNCLACSTRNLNPRHSMIQKTSKNVWNCLRQANGFLFTPGFRVQIFLLKWSICNLNFTILKSIYPKIWMALG